MPKDDSAEKVLGKRPFPMSDCPESAATAMSFIAKFTGGKKYFVSEEGQSVR